MSITTPTQPSSPPSPSPDHAPPPGDRTGAIWVTASGALPLFAAASTFVAVRWDHLADWQKFGALVVVTQALLAAGWLGRRRLPATAAAVFSLGAVLVPLDAWAAAASGARAWQHGLAAGALFGIVAIPVARRLLDTVALRWAWVAVVPLGCGGAAVLSGVPPAVVLAALGAVALVLDRRREAVAWLGAAALAPLVALVDPLLPIGHGVLDDLVLRGPNVAWSSAATALVLAVALIVDGSRHRRDDLLAPGAALVVLDVVLALVDGHVNAGGWWAAAATAFLVVELATATTTDPFWSPRLDTLAGRLVWPAGEAVLVLAGVRWSERIAGGLGMAGIGSWTITLVAAVFALGWMLEDDRLGRRAGRTRRLTDVLGGPSVAPVVMTTAFVALAVASLPVDAAWIRLGLLAVGALLVGTARCNGSALAAAVVAAAAIPTTHRTIDVAIGLLALIGLAVVARGERDDVVAHLVTAAQGLALGGWSLSLLADASLPATLGVTSGDGHRLVLVATLVVGLVAGSLAAPRRRTLLALPAWACAGGALLALVTGHPSATAEPLVLAAAVAATAWWTIEAMWRREHAPLVLAGGSLLGVTPSLARLAGLDAASTGVALAVVAAVLVGVSISSRTMVVGRAPADGLLVAAAIQALAALAFAAGDATAIGVVVAILGMVVAALGVDGRETGLVYSGVVVTLLGVWQTLFGLHVATPEAYLAPLAVVLLGAGAHGRATRRLSSWAAYAPGLVVWGGSSALLRFTGAPGWHALSAGAVAVVAVAVGSSRRLAAPLVVGSTLLATLTVHETVRVSAGVPTWMWLAVGGTALLGTGVGLELRGLGPVESGRRLAEVVSERFE